MKYLVALALIMSALTASAKDGDTRTVRCVGIEDYYPTEITAVVVSNKVVDVTVTTEEGEVGAFKKEAFANAFSATRSELITNTIVTFSQDMKAASLTIVNKNGGSVLASEIFDCQ